MVFIFFINFCNSAYNQVISGIVLDQNTKTAIDFAIVYFNGTTVGTNTDKNGEFELGISKYKSMPLTISALGYYSFTIDKLSADKKLTVYLTAKVFELNEMVITAKGNPERIKNLALFKKEFLGESPNSLKCRILNENEISFKWDEKKDTLKAFASNPILIENQGLGYTIKLYLDKFVFCKSSNVMLQEGNIIFKEDSTSNESQKQIFNKAREEAYHGSRMHFIRSLWANNLKSESFTVQNSTWQEPDYNDYVFTPDCVKDKSSIKYLKYGNLYIYYKGEPLSYFSFLKEKACFQKNGHCDNGIIWYDKIAEKPLADALPFEYTVNPNSIVSPHTPGNMH